MGRIMDVQRRLSRRVDGLDTVLDWAGGDPRFHPRFCELGRHYGFTPKACRPRRAQTNGKVERMVRYVADNALAGAPAFDSWDDLNAYLRG